MHYPKEILIIFDDNINIYATRKKLSTLRPSKIYLFPLTSNWQLVDELNNILQNLFDSDTEVHVMESAELIDKEVEVLRERIAKWSAELGNYKIEGRSLKEWFLLPNSEISSWWFSLISEKNTLKTKAFFHIAQIQAIDKIITLNTYDLCILSVHDRERSMAIEMLCNRHSIKTSAIKSRCKQGSFFREWFTLFLSRNGAGGSILDALVYFIKYISKGIMARAVLGAIKNRVKISDNSILFVSYFPAVEKEEAKKGILKNKFAIPLQEKLSKMDKKIIWIWLYVFMDGHKYKDAISLARKFTRNGEANFLIYEFVSFTVLRRVLSLWFYQIRTFIKLRKLLQEQITNKELSVPEGSIFIKKLMVESFVGVVGLEGILFFESFKAIFSYFPGVSPCIYYSEMHAWEKALCAAKRLKSSETRLIGYQHTGVSLNFFGYFHHPSEMDSVQRDTSLPLPDVFACNGDIPLELFTQCGYPNIKKVEAIRFLYLSDYVKNERFSQKRNIVCIIGSWFMEDTKALISLFNAAFPHPKGFKVWLKGHPSLPLEDVFKELGICVEDSQYEIKHDPISTLMKVARVALVGGSTVSLEALAAGCKLISPVFSDYMFVSPIKGFEEFYERVYTPGQLREIIEKSINVDIQNEQRHKALEFVTKYWCLDKSLQRWEKILR